MKNIYIVLDLEATCEEPKTDSYQNEIIEIGACLATEYGVVLDEFQVFVKPVVNPVLTDFCVQLTHITQEQVDSSPGYLEAIDKFDSWIRHCQEKYGSIKSWCSWGEYDRKQFLRNSALLNVRDTDLLEIPHLNLKNAYGVAVGRKKKMVGLGKALACEKMRFEGSPHCGLDDAKNAARLLSVALGHIKSKWIPGTESTPSMGM